MAEAPFHNPENFQRSIALLIDRADAANRGDDLDRLVAHVKNTPANVEVSSLASLMFTIDEDFRPQLEREVEAYRRWLKKKDKPCDDQSIVAAMLVAYRAKRDA